MIFILKGGEEYEFPELEMRLLRAEYPRINVDEELLKASAWCRMTPSKRKTKRGIGRFIANWLSRAQDRIKTDQVVHAASHKAFQGDLYKTSDEDKRRGEAQLARMQKMIDARAEK